jgi:hypothetical protein
LFKTIISSCQFNAATRDAAKDTLTTIEGVIDKNRQQVFEVTMKTQEVVYQDVYKKDEGRRLLHRVFLGRVSKILRNGPRCFLQNQSCSIAASFGP